MAGATVVVLVGLVALVSAVQRVAVTSMCDDVDQAKCTVGEVRIDPCRENGPCKFKRGIDATIEFDFTPNFSATTLKTGVWGIIVAGVDTPFAGLSSNDACLGTTCPTTAGQPQTFTNVVHIGTKLPKGTFTFKWKVWNSDNDSEKCCFKTTVVLHK